MREGEKRVSGGRGVRVRGGSAERFIRCLSRAHALFEHCRPPGRRPRAKRRPTRGRQAREAGRRRCRGSKHPTQRFERRRLRALPSYSSNESLLRRWRIQRATGEGKEGAAASQDAPPESTIESPWTSLTASSAEAQILETDFLASKRAAVVERERVARGSCVCAGAGRQTVEAGSRLREEEEEEEERHARDRRSDASWGGATS